MVAVTADVVIIIQKLNHLQFDLQKKKAELSGELSRAQNTPGRCILAILCLCKSTWHSRAAQIS
jgi:hypothetical protein